MSVRLSKVMACEIKHTLGRRLADFAGCRTLLAAWVVWAFAGSGHAATLLVNHAATGAEDGLSWNTAFRTLPAALDAAVAGDEVWVARGRYIGTISLKSSVRLYGGFASGETNLEQRNPLLNVTVLDGGGPTGTVNSVVVAKGASAQTVLDGFEVQGGRVDGLYSVDSSLQVTGCRFSENGDDGVDVDGGAPTLSDCTFSGNGDDGLDSDDSALTVSGCTVFRNTHDGLQLNNSAALVTQNTIYENGDDGINCDSDTPRIIANAISDNGDDGIDANYSAVEIRGNLITGNAGDGIYCFTASPVIIGNQVRGNGDDGIDCYISQATIANNLVAGNGAGRGNNGIECYNSRPALTNNTIVENADHGVVLLNSPLTAVNNIVAFQPRGINARDIDSTTILRNNCVYNPEGASYTGVPDPTGTGGNIAADPLFVDRPGGDYHLSASSPCRDAGDDSVVGVGDTDLDGDPRKVGAHVDIGADERVVTAGFARGDVAEALKVAGGPSAWNAAGTPLLDIEPLTGRLTIADALRLARKAAGTDTNP